MNQATRKEFVALLEQDYGRKVNRSTISRWVEKGRVIEADGLVDVEKSLALLQLTKGGREDVARRHREEAQDKGQRQPDNKRLAAFREDRAEAETRMAIAKADREEMERDKLAGNLIEKDVVDFALNDFGATLRGLMETLADRLAPVIFPLQTLEETHAALEEAAEAVLQEMSAAMKRRQGEHEH